MTLPADRGVFIEQTRRMDPDICRFAVYPGVECVRGVGGAGPGQSGTTVTAHFRPDARLTRASAVTSAQSRSSASATYIAS